MAAEVIPFLGILAILLLILWLALIGLAILAFIFWILMLVDVVQRNFKKDNDKIIWVLIIIFTGVIGAIIYYYLVKKKNKN